MPDIQRREPIVFAAGDTLNFIRHFPEFPSAAGWSLTYSLFAINGQSVGTPVDSATVTGDVYGYLMTAVNFAAALPAGTYVLVGYANNSSTNEQHQIYRGQLTLTENLALGTPTNDQTCFEAKMVKQLQEGLARLYANELQETDVQRVRILRVSRKELRVELNFWEERLIHHRKQETIRNTGRNPNSIAPLFGGGW